MKPTKARWLGWMFFVLAILLIGGGIGIYVFIERVIRNGILNAVVIRPGTDGYDRWRLNFDEPTIQGNTYSSFYLWNLTNPSAAANGSKPVFEQRGPYVYLKARTRVSISFNSDQSNVQYKDVQQYYFQPELSVGSPSDVIINANQLYAGGLMQADGDEQTLFIGLSYVVIQKALDFFASDLFLQQVASSFRRAIQVPAFVNGSRVYASRLDDYYEAISKTSQPNQCVSYLGAGCEQYMNLLSTHTDLSIVQIRGLLDISRPLSPLNASSDIYWAAACYSSPEFFSQKEAQVYLLFQFADLQLTLNNLLKICSWIQLTNDAVHTSIEATFRQIDPTFEQFSDIPFFQFVSGAASGFSNSYLRLFNLPDSLYVTFGLYWRSQGTMQPWTLLSTSVAKSCFIPSRFLNQDNWARLLQDQSSGKSMCSAFVNPLGGIYVSLFALYLGNAVIPAFLQNQPQSQLYARRTVDEWLFNCFDTFLNMSCSLLSNDSSLREAERTHLFNAMTTGISDSSLTNLYTMWNGMSEIRGIYPVVEKVEGTDATQFRPFLQDLSTRKPIAGSDRLGVFVDDLLRSVDVVKEYEYSWNGIDLWRYRLDPSTLAPNPDYNQYEQGLANLTTLFQAPIFFSKPGFYQCDPRIENLIEGVHGNEEMSETDIDVEPYTGAGFRVFKRLQLVVRLLPEFQFVTGNFPRVYYPIFWVNDGGQANDKNIDDMKSQIYLGLTLMTATFWSCVGVGIIFFGLSFYFLRWHSHHRFDISVSHTVPSSVSGVKKSSSNREVIERDSSYVENLRKPSYGSFSKDMSESTASRYVDEAYSKL